MAHMGRRPQHLLVDRLLKGRLAESLTAWRDEGLSFESMAFRLHAEHDIEVTSETVRRWYGELCEAAS